MRDAHFIHPWRKHQAEALSAFESSHRRADRNHYIVLPPGAGKTHVGLEISRRLGRPTVALCPNTAIQGQWLAAWRQFVPTTIEATTSRDLPTPLTVLTYQSVAVFDPDAEVDEEGKPTGSARGSHLDRLHRNGRELVDRLHDGGPWTIVLDECHHLLEVWGRLLVEIVGHVSHGDRHRVTVIGLTATPASRLTTAEHQLVQELFGEITYSASTPAVVKSGHIAPYQELAMLTQPTAAELDYITAESERFAELITDLLAGDFGGTPFLSWCDARFVHRIAADSTAEIPWGAVERRQPELAAAAVRLHVAGLLDLPAGARVREEHRRALDAADWAALISDWVRGRLGSSTDERDVDALHRLRKALPSVGYQLTRRGVRVGRSPVDRVLARSAAKGTAVLDILGTEHAALGSRLRMIVICDHERATAQLSARLRLVLAEDAGSARLVLKQLVADASALQLDPILVTGRAVACAVPTALRLTAWVAKRVPDLGLEVVPNATDDGVVEIVGRWRSRQWTGLVTRYFEDGHSQVLIGTRGLLGEGWDARRVNVVVDLTTATTSTAVVQLRGRGVRLDPTWPAKVANTWTVVTVAEGHPKGAADYARFVAKHDGFFATDGDGQITSGVAHVDASFSPYGPPPSRTFDAINANMRGRAMARARARDLWRIHEPYEDVATRVVRIRAERSLGLTGRHLDAVVPPWRASRPGDWRPAAGALALGGASYVAASAASVSATPVVAAGTAVGYAGTRAVLTASELLAPDRRSGLPHIAVAVAEALSTTELIGVGGQDVEITTRPDGSYMAALRHASEAHAAVFADALDEVLSPLADPRYLVSRPLVEPPRSVGRAVVLVVRRGLGFGTRGAEVWHAVPTVLATNRERAEAFLAAWRRWVSRGRLVYGNSPEGAGVLTAQRGEDPFAITTAMRTVWR